MPEGAGLQPTVGPAYLTCTTHDAWWEGAVTIHSPKDGFYRPTARATGFTFPLLVNRPGVEPGT